MFSLKKLFLLFIPLFAINSALPMWRRATTTQSRSLAPRFTRSPRTAALFSQARRPATRVIEQRTNTPIRKRIFSSQRTNRSWFDWTKWKRSAWVVGATLFGAGVSQKDNVVVAEQNNEITIASVNKILDASRDTIEEYVKEIIEKNQLEELVSIIIENFESFNKKEEFSWLIFYILHRPLTKWEFIFGDQISQQLIQASIDNIVQIKPDIISTILRCKRKAVDQFIQPIVDNFAQVNSSLIYHLLLSKPKAADTFVQPAIDNITQIKGLIVHWILYAKPELALQFVQPAIDNIAQIDPSIVEWILNANTQLANKFIKPITENFTPKMNRIVCTILQAKPEAAESFIQTAIDNIIKIDPSIVDWILKAKPEIAEQFVQAAIDNINQIGYGIVHRILRFEPEFAQQFADAALDSINQIDSDIVYQILRFKPELAQQFAEAALDNITKINPFLLCLLPIECNDKIKKAIEQLQQKENNNIDTILKILILSKKICNQQDCKLKCCTQTCHHLQDNFDNISDSLGKLFEMASKVNQKEKELQDDYYTFVHGQRWYYQFGEIIFTRLQELINNKQYPDFLFAHIKEFPIDTQQEEYIHQGLLQAGRTDRQSRQRLLFLNYAFFGNSSNLGSSTVHYIESNSNVGNITIDIRQLFKWNDLEHIYDKYQQGLDELKEEHNQLSKIGNLLLVAVPKNIVDKSVFPAVPGGNKKTIKTIDGKKITTTTELLEAIKFGKVKDTDRQEFCLIMTNSKYGGLNPESGIKIFDFNTVKEEEWAAYKEKEEALFEKIKADILASQDEDKSSFAKDSEDRETAAS